jgi:hypothetical protein
MARTAGIAPGGMVPHVPDRAISWVGSGGECEQAVTLAAWPMPTPQDWTEWVNGTENRNELQRLRTSVYQGRPYGRLDWQQRAARQRGLESSHGATGRPKKFAEA